MLLRELFLSNNIQLHQYTGYVMPFVTGENAFIFNKEGFLLLSVGFM